MPRKRLTQLSIENMRPDLLRRVEVPDGNGLYLLVQPSGAKSWAYRYRRPGGGKPAKLTLGPFRTLREGECEPAAQPTLGEPLSLKQARWLAGQVGLGVAVGEDPAAERKRAKTEEHEAGDRDHFDVVARRFLERYARTNTRPSTFGQTLNVLGFIEASGRLELRSHDTRREHPRAVDTWPATRWRGRKAQTITRRDVNELLDEIVDAGSPHASNATLAAISRLFGWAVEQGILPASPAVGVKKRTPTVRRERVLSDAELRLVWLAADEVGEPFGHLVKLLALTGARRDEWAGATWSEIDSGRRVFHLPASRSKNGLAHDIPLSPRAVEVLEDLSRLKGEPDYIFTTGQGRAAAAENAPLVPVSGFSKAKRHLDATIAAIQARQEAERAARTGEAPVAVNPMADWRIHDLRRTAVTGMGRLGVRVEVAERAVNHVSGTFAGVVGVYQRHDYANEVRDALERWAAAIERAVAADYSLQSKLTSSVK
jgi:integrase